MNTSQNRSIAASEAPKRRSSAPNVSPGSARAFRQRAVTMGIRTRSRAGRCRYRSSDASRGSIAATVPSSAITGKASRVRRNEPPLADPVEEAQVLGEAAEPDVLAVVGRGLRISLPLRERLNGAAERRPRLEHRHGVARVDEVERRREPREPTAHHRDLHGRSSFATTASLRGVESRTFSPKTSKPPRLDPVERLAVEAGERADAERAAAIERPEEVQPLGQVRARPGGVERHECQPFRRDPTLLDVLLADAEGHQLVLREIDAAEAPVLGDVAHDVDQLERDPDSMA